MTTHLNYSPCHHPATTAALPNIVALLRTRAVEYTTEKAFIFLKDGETEIDSLSFETLDARARAIAVTLLQTVRPQARVVLAFAPGLDFIAAFFGCLYAGIIAVPVYPPMRAEDWPRFEKIVRNAGASTVLTHAAAHGTTRRVNTATHVDALQGIHYLDMDMVQMTDAAQWQAPKLQANDLAFLQYTSGSTGTPKGVMVSHGNILHNQRIIQQGFQNPARTICVGWLPLYHDMGLIGNVLGSLYLGALSVLMAPTAFIFKPVRWLQAITRYRATTSGGPNFAYELCTRRVTDEQRAALDLSSWEIAYNGAEAIRATTLKNFATTFAPCGFRSNTFLCCYGLAESTLYVTGKRQSQTPTVFTVDANALQQHRVQQADHTTQQTATFVACGSSVELKVMIVDPITRLPCSANGVGEIWVQGASVAQGYWDAPDSTEITFNAYLADTQAGPFMRTGDLGFMHAGQLFITGRLKELIIIRGRNYYPQDIEKVVQASHRGFRVDGGAAFAIEVNGEETVVVVQEVYRSDSRTVDIDAAIAAARLRVTTELGLPLHDLILVKQGSVPKTSSGKARRNTCRDAYLAGTLEILHKNTATTQTTVAA